MLICFSMSNILFAQQNKKDTSQTTKEVVINHPLSEKELSEIIVSGSKFLENKKNIVQKIDRINKSYISKANTQNMGDLLMNTGNIFVQKSQQGGSSPVIRGFEASRVLLVVDGVRLNNLIYRSGHLQNAITIDQNMLDHVEVLQGPSSTLYGSDALGGAVHVVTLLPKLSEVKTNVFTRYSSANNEKTVHTDLNLGWKKIAMLTSITASDFGDVHIGKKDMKGYEGFGTRPFYVQPHNGILGDTVVKNGNDRVQVYSGYRQLDLLQKFLFKPNEHISHSLNLQYSTTSNVPRYDRLQDIKNGTLRYAEWYYGPQDRSLFAYTFSAKNQKGFFNEYNATLSHQSIEESRITREYKRYDRFDKRVENVHVEGLTIDARKKMGADEITTGVDAQWNDLKSVGTRSNILTQYVAKLDSRYPDGKNTMNSFAMYAQHTHKFNTNTFVLNDGVRLQYIDLYSKVNDNSFFNLPVTEVSQKNTSLTGNLGVAYMPSDATRIRLGLATGFRAPNIDDLAKIFESSTASKQVVVPNADLKPEYTSNIEAGITQKIGSRVEVDINAFYTNFTHAIIKAPFKLNGQDSILYNGVKSQVLASQNVNHAFVYGGDISVKATAGLYWKFAASLNITKGRFFTDASKTSSIYQKQSNGIYALVQAKVASKPLDHIPPVFGKLSAGYDNGKAYAELYMFYNGWKRLDAYNADGEDNAQYATVNGTPAWQTFNFKAGLPLNSYLKLQAAVENIFDLNYRYFASGFSAPGRSLIVSLKAGF